MIRVTVSGSFHRHMPQIYRDVGLLVDAGVHILFLADPRIVDAIDTFDFVASDVLRSIKLTQDRHLQAIRVSDFLCIVSPDGYVGFSVAMEIGRAAMLGVPMFCTTPISDPRHGRTGRNRFGNYGNPGGRGEPSAAAHRRIVRPDRSWANRR